MFKAMQRFLFTLLLLMSGLYLGYQALLYSSAQTLFPPQTTMAGLDVSELTPEQAAERLTNAYNAPIFLYHQEERIQINPSDVGFTLDMPTMLAELAAQKPEQTFWQGFTEYLIGHSFSPMSVELKATYNRDAIVERLNTIAQILDQPVSPPLLNEDTLEYQEGKDGYTTDVDASLPLVEAALISLQNRDVHLVVVTQAAPPWGMESLRTAVERDMQGFDGVGSFFIMDLTTGDELNINADEAISGLSILKIAIFEEAYRALNNPPDDYIKGLFLGTATRSSNYDANLLLHVVAGEENTYRGADILTESMHRLGLVNTFIAVPYDATPPTTRQSTYTTPANSRPTMLLDPDPTMQTTAAEVGTLLSMIYYCAKGGGTLLAVYPGQITPEECQAIIDLMVLNVEGNLIRFGVPEEVPVSHKHGWDLVTHGDAGIVFSPGGDYIIVEYLSAPGSDWLDHNISFPILREISRTVYNHFNATHPNRETVEARSERVVAATATAEYIATATAAAMTPTPEGTPAATVTPTP